MHNIYLSVVVPAYNEEKNLRSGILKETFRFLRKQNYVWEVIAVDDGSEDETVRLLNGYIGKNKNMRILREPHRGKAGAIISGLKAAKGEVVVVTDFDQSTPISEVRKLLPRLEKGFDIAIGVRHKRKNAPLIRQLTGWGFILLRQLILGLAFSDTQCGFKLFRRRSVIKILAQMNLTQYLQIRKKPNYGVAFDLELLYLAQILGLKVAEAPIEWRFRPGTGGNVLKSSWQAFRDLLLVRHLYYKKKHWL